MNRKARKIEAKVTAVGNGAHIIVPKQYLGMNAEVIIFPLCFQCKYYRKKGEICKTDACVNKKYILTETGKKEIDYIAFASNLPELPKNCKYFEEKIK
ncbi:hypothetical protein B6U93_01695 [Candidatus Woesearchaeota archaeon ex4484_78]|nr:MAG: hypothetical protein B6U93_01695 [Candidatus Woesearchaeota archaeon ex4484_78]